MIGGGGGGCGADGGGGGGAGGIRTNISGIIPAPYTNGAMALPATTYPVQVGRGGARTGALPASGGYDVGKDGESSGFNSLVAGGGGRGGFGGPGNEVPGPFQAGGGGSNNSSGGGGGSNGAGGGGGGAGAGHGGNGAGAPATPSWMGGGGGGAVVGN